MENSINYLQEIASLYDEFIVAEEVPQMSPKEKEKIRNSPKFSGGSKTGILMIFDRKLGLPDAEQLMMDNLITNALKFDKNEVAYLNIAEQEEIGESAILTLSEFNKFVFWGVGEADYKINKTGDNHLIHVESVSAYLNDALLKRKLWDHLKPFFETV